MNFAALFKALDTAIVLRETVRRLKSGPQPAETAVATTPAAVNPGQLEARLTNVVVAALKEAFDRDHARLELERAQLEEQRRRADEALRAELRRHAIDRELGRLRLVTGTALVGWIASVAMFIARLSEASVASRAVVAVAWLLLLSALATSFAALRRVGEGAATEPPIPHGEDMAVWLLVTGLALSAVSLLF
jgi:hypothetical protein